MPQTGFRIPMKSAMIGRLWLAVTPIFSLIQTSWTGPQCQTSMSVCKVLNHPITLPLTQLQETHEVVYHYDKYKINNTLIIALFAAPQTLAFDSGVSDSLGAGERTYYEFIFDTDGVTLRLFVTTGTIICYASDLIQNPNEEQGYVWKVTSTDYIDVFLDPDSLTRSVGSTLYVGLEGADTSNNFSTTGDQRSEDISVAQCTVHSIQVLKWLKVQNFSSTK